MSHFALSVIFQLHTVAILHNNLRNSFNHREQVRKVGNVARAIAIMSHPIPNTNDSDSVQVILPQKQLDRKSDM